MAKVVVEKLNKHYGEVMAVKDFDAVSQEMGSDFVISLFCSCGLQPDSFPTS